MKLRYFGLAIAFSAAMVGSAIAETKADKFGLGNHDPVPEKVGKIDKDLTIRVRLIREKTGDFAIALRKGEIVDVEVSYIGRDGAEDRPVSLVCTVQFIDTQAEKTASTISGKPCMEGRLQDSWGRFARLDMTLRFRAEEKDPAGTYGVIVRVDDSVTGKHVTLVPTYGWPDGKK
jgi:hypothetical protein